MIEKTLRMNYLYDFYQSLLTEKQNHYMMMYYLDDWSLGEIASSYDVSRQAVYDNIKRTEVLLEEYERKLQLFSRYTDRKKLLQEFKDAILNKKDHESLLTFIETLEKLE